MKKFFKDSTYLSIFIATIFMLATLISFIFVKIPVYFTIMYALNIVTIFSVMLFNIIKKDNDDSLKRYTSLSVFLLIGLFIIIMDNLTIYLGWDMSIYSNVMYFTNIKMYSIVYAIFALSFTLYDGYIVIKDKVAKTPMLINELDLTNDDSKIKKPKKVKKVKESKKNK